MAKSGKFSSAQCKAIAKKNREGMSVNALAKEYGAFNTTIITAIKSTGAVPRMQKINDPRRKSKSTAPAKSTSKPKTKQKKKKTRFVEEMTASVDDLSAVDTSSDAPTVGEVYSPQPIDTAELMVQVARLEARIEHAKQLIALAMQTLNEI